MRICIAECIPSYTKPDKSAVVAYVFLYTIGFLLTTLGASCVLSSKPLGIVIIVFGSVLLECWIVQHFAYFSAAIKSKTSVVKWIFPCMKDAKDSQNLLERSQSKDEAAVVTMEHTEKEAVEIAHP